MCQFIYSLNVWHKQNDVPFLEINDMKKAIQNLNPNKSLGPDNLHQKLLKNSSILIAKPLKILFDTSLKFGL